jgi:hypothetical protein
MSNPIDSTMSCAQFANALSDLLERDVDEAGRARLEAHSARCGECGPLLADLRKLRIDAANLPTLTPSRDLWTGIAARIETPVVEILPGGGAVERWNGGTVERSSGSNPRRRFGPMWVGLAAAGLVAVTATVTREVTKSNVATPSSAAVAVTASNAPDRTPPAQSPTTSDTVPPFHRSTAPPQSSTVPPLHRSTVQPVALSAEATFDAEIKRLRAIVAARRSTLDTTTIAVIEKNLKVIDGAIAQCRDALRRDPASRFLIESLNDALDTKVQLLRTAAMLPARS